MHGRSRAGRGGWRRGAPRPRGAPRTCLRPPCGTQRCAAIRCGRAGHRGGGQQDAGEQGQATPTAWTTRRMRLSPPHPVRRMVLPVVAARPDGRDVARTDARSSLLGPRTASSPRTRGARAPRTLSAVRVTLPCTRVPPSWPSLVVADAGCAAARASAWRSRTSSRRPSAAGVEHVYDGSWEFFVGGGVADLRLRRGRPAGPLLRRRLRAGSALPQRQPGRRRAPLRAAGRRRRRT